MPGDSAQRRSPWIVATVSAVIVASLVLGVALATRFGVDPNYVASAVIDRKVPALELPRLGADGSISLDAPAPPFTTGVGDAYSHREENP